MNPRAVADLSHFECDPFTTITDNGRTHLKKWLRLPVKKDELRYETLLKLFFGNEEGELQAISHIEAFQEKIAKELPYLLSSQQTLEKHIDNDKTHKYYLLTVKLGIQTYNAYLEWCKEAMEVLGRDCG